MTRAEPCTTPKSPVNCASDGMGTRVMKAVPPLMDKPNTSKNDAGPQEPNAPSGWTAEDAQTLYGIDRWGRDYFSINQAGHLAVHPTHDPGIQIDLKDLVEQLRQRDVQPPLLIRFTDILRHRLSEMAQVFQNAIKEMQFKGGYRCVYPIKVNQQRHVVEEILAFGREHGFGLEAGSKPELLAVLAMVEDETTPIICNGFKDEQFIEAVILATKLGKNIIPVVEKYSELELIVRYAKKHGVRPQIGIRVKLATKGSGRWEQSGGMHSKFGLFIGEVLDAVAYLKDQGMLDCLNLLHFHLGSQITTIAPIKRAIIEMVRIYCELHKAGAGLKYIDVGGGLGVDYDGSKTDVSSSINYSLQEYATDVVYHIQELCDESDVPHPTIISESGRAMVAYHSVLIFNVLGSSGFDGFEPPGEMPRQEVDELPHPIRSLYDAYFELDEKTFAQSYHDAQVARDEAMNLFNLGYCSLELRALAERFYYAVCFKALGYVREMPDPPQDFKALETLLCRTYFCNFSIFQSMPDSWAIDQLFPIMPIHRLNEKPTCRGILADITCDSDGKIDHFIGKRQANTVLPLHPINNGDDYYIGAFMVGAYQEILGDLHNLLGDTNAVHVSVDESGRASIDEVIEGDSVTEVLQYVQYDTDQLRRNFRRSVEAAVRSGRLTVEEATRLRRFYEQGLVGYTYLT
jgi:arginine decarboxylase